AGDRDIADVGNGDVAFEAVNLLVAVHDDEAIRIDQRSHVEADTDLELLDGSVGTISAATVITGRRIGARFTHEQAGRNGVGGLNARALKNFRAAVALGGGNSDVEVRVLNQVTEPARQNAVGAGVTAVVRGQEV